MFDQHARIIRNPIALVRQRLVVKRIKKEPKLWQVCLQEQVLNHPLPWVVVCKHGFLVVAHDGELVYSCPSKQRAELIVRAANYYGS